MAAEPVSPEVATTIVRRSPRRASSCVEQAADELQRDVLEGERRPVEQLLHPQMSSSSCTTGQTSSWSERRVRVDAVVEVVAVDAVDEAAT